jgi:FeS assembly SUF system regulator
MMPRAKGGDSIAPTRLAREPSGAAPERRQGRMIRMSKLTDYAIVILAHLARNSGTLTAQDLSSRSRVPLPTVSKLCKELSKAGLVVSHRGRRGGYGLARPAERISVAEIVEALEGPIALTECAQPGPNTCELDATCPAKASWDPVSRAIHDALKELPLSAIAPHRAPDPAPAEVPVTLGAHAS